jgi:hypothetical protein
MTQLVQLLLPLLDNEGRALPDRLFSEVREELVERFGGLTAFTRAPAEGLWKTDADDAHRDAIVVFEVMCEELDPHWWAQYRRGLETRFRQEQLVIRAQTVELL